MNQCPTPVAVDTGAAGWGLRAVWGSFVPPLARFEAFRGPLVQDFCPMLGFFFRPYFNRGFGPVGIDPDDLPSQGSSFISLSFHIANMRPGPSLFQPGTLPQSNWRPRSASSSEPVRRRS
jgi:hypothetical protein